MKTLNKYAGLLALGIILFLFAYAGITDKTGDNIITLGNLFEFRESGTNFTIKYNDTTHLTMAKLMSGSVTFANTGTYTFPGVISATNSGVSTFEQLSINPSVGVSEIFYVEGNSRMTGHLVMSGVDTGQVKMSSDTVSDYDGNDAVTLSRQAGIITTKTLTTASASAYSITVTNTMVNNKTTSIVAVLNNNGTNTTEPVIVSVTPGAGSFVIKFWNAAGGALNGTLAANYILNNRP